ncbi:hypothetical protein BVRB_034200, partial [Beta vulgaris subsp. vulgaris]
SLSNDNLTLRFRAQAENTIRTVITPLSSNPPLFQTPIQKPALLTPSVSEVKTTRDQALQIKRFRQFAQTIVASARTRSSPIPQHLALWRTHAEKLQNTVQQTLSAIVSPVANNLRLFWDELLPGYAESAIRLYNESCTNGVYAQDIHQTNAKKSLEHIRANLPAHVYNQLERNHFFVSLSIELTIYCSRPVKPIRGDLDSIWTQKVQCYKCDRTSLYTFIPSNRRSVSCTG